MQPPTSTNRRQANGASSRGARPYLQKRSLELRERRGRACLRLTMATALLTDAESSRGIRTRLLPVMNS